MIIQRWQFNAWLGLAGLIGMILTGCNHEEGKFIRSPVSAIFFNK
jgi:hypothetical protein